MLMLHAFLGYNDVHVVFWHGLQGHTNFSFKIFAMITVVSVKVHIKSQYKLNSLEFSYNRCELNCKVYCFLPSFTIILVFY
jgi:hypothetical protein